MRQGMIQIYCGDGKGKTTAATGLAVRAAGSGMKVLFARFLKNENSAELCVLDQIPGIEVIHLPKSYGFYNTQSEEERQRQSRCMENCGGMHWIGRKMERVTCLSWMNLWRQITMVWFRMKRQFSF